MSKAQDKAAKRQLMIKRAKAGEAKGKRRGARRDKAWKTWDTNNKTGDKLGYDTRFVKKALKEEKSKEREKKATGRTKKAIKRRDSRK